MTSQRNNLIRRCIITPLAWPLTGVQFDQASNKHQPEHYWAVRHE